MADSQDLVLGHQHLGVKLNNEMPQIKRGGGAPKISFNSGQLISQVLTFGLQFKIVFCHLIKIVINFARTCPI